MFPEYVAMAVVMVAWTAYPLLARSTGVGGAEGALVLTLSALLPIGGKLFWQGDGFKLTNGQGLRLLLAGCMMGTGTIAFNFVVNSRKIDASSSVPIIDTGLIVLSVIGAALFFAEPLTARKLVGVGLLLSGIAVLKPA